MFDEFEQEVHKCLVKAEQLFGISFGRVDISFKLKGRCAADALVEDGECFLRFNGEAISEYWEHFVSSTIPHEVAHLVGPMARNSQHSWARYINGHNSYWARAACLLGDTDHGARTHDLPLKSAKEMNSYLYVDPLGGKIEISAVVHNRIQQGAYYISRKTGRPIKPEYCKGSTKWAEVSFKI